MLKDTFSIITPVFNAEKTLKQTIDSVINQTYSKWELILIDDSSKDNSKEIITTYVDNKKIKLFKNKKNMGVANSRNKGIQLAKGEFICFLDADDYWHVKKLEEQYKVFKDGGKIVYSPYYRLLSNKKLSFRSVKSKLTYFDFCVGNPIPNLTGAFHRSLLPIKQKAIGHEDYLMWFQLFMKTKDARSTKKLIPLAYYKVGNNTKSSNKIRALVWHWHIMYNYITKNLLLAFLCMLIYVCNSLQIRLKEKFGY